MPSSLPHFELPVDRGKAFVRGLWRLAGAVIAAGTLSLVRPDWRLLALTERASFLAIGFGWLVLAALTLTLLIVALLWMLLGAWPRPLRISIAPDGIRLWLGPFGSMARDWSAIRTEFDGLADEDQFDLMPDDSIAYRLVDRSTGRDLAATIQRFGGLDHEKLTRLLRPYLRTALGRER